MGSTMTSAIRIFPDPVLRTKTRLIKPAQISILKPQIELLDMMMRRQKHGIGIAAPQLGLELRLALVDVSCRIKTAKRLVLINPEILSESGDVLSREGCMSLPDYRGDVRRFSQIRLRWLDESGCSKERDFEGIEAICIQHEVDHLNGLLFMDRIANLRRDLLPRKLS